MLKIDRKTLSRLGDLSHTCGEIFDEMEALRDKFSEDAQALLDALEGHKEEARGLMDDAANAADEYYDDKSERWQESERGEAYGEWRDRLREIEGAIAEDVEAPEVQMPDRPDWVDTIGDLDCAEFEFEG